MNQTSFSDTARPAIVFQAAAVKNKSGSFIPAPLSEPRGKQVNDVRRRGDYHVRGAGVRETVKPEVTDVVFGMFSCAETLPSQIVRPTTYY